MSDETKKTTVDETTSSLEEVALKFQEAARSAAETLRGFNDFVESLSETDRANLTAMIRLPNAVELLRDYPQETDFQRRYKECALVGVAIRNFSESHQRPKKGV